MNTTISDVVTFILRYRLGSPIWPEANETDIYNLVSDAMESSCIVIDTDLFGLVQGVCIATDYPEDRRLHIVACITISRGTTSKFASWLKNQTTRDGYYLTAMRRDKLVEYRNTERFLNLIKRMK